MRYSHYWLMIGLISLTTVGCDLGGDDDDPSGRVTLTGQVLSSETNNPLAEAFVRVQPFNRLVETNGEGRYETSIEIDSTMNLSVTATKTGYTSASTNVLALAGRTVSVPTLRLNQIGDDSPVSGRASNILLLDQSDQNIGVKESGSKEVAKITFQVADSLGRPVVLDHAVDVDFEFGVRPGGGEFIFPERARTDNNGQVVVNLSSGMSAGVVQLVATTVAAGRTIRSQPVSITIHGGLPDQAHFSVGPERFNFPGLRTFGLVNPISIIVGDEFGNPVKPGTAVYFTTDGGVIEGSVLTDSRGQGSVNLLSANPLPSDGIARISASTADENQSTVTDQTAVVFSGVPIITVSPSTPQLGQTYSLTVVDQNGNPLVEGTAITVRAEGTKVKAVGNTSVRLGDTVFLGGFEYDHVLRGAGITEFTFAVVEDLSNEDEEGGVPTIETITILVNGPNGSLEIVLGGFSGAAVQAEALSAGDVQVEALHDDAIRVRFVEE